MTPDQARHVLGVQPDTDPGTLRRAYRRLLHAHHPDVAGEEATLRAATIIEAYEVLRSIPVAPPPPKQGPEPRETPPVQAEAVSLRAVSPALFEQLRAAADVIGDLTYVDRTTGLLETLVQWEGWPPCSLLLAVEQRGRDTVAQCTLESLDGRPGPPIERVVNDLQRALKGSS